MLLKNVAVIVRSITAVVLETIAVLETHIDRLLFLRGRRNRH